MFRLDPEGLHGTEMFRGEEVWRRGRRVLGARIEAPGGERGRVWGGGLPPHHAGLCPSVEFLFSILDHEMAFFRAF